jgi:predicted ATPase
VLVGLEIFHIARGEFQPARELGEQLRQLAQSVQDPAFLVTAQNLLGQTLYFLGELVSAREHLEQGIAVYDPSKHHTLVLYATDHGVMCHCFAAYVLWQLGYPDQALQRAHEALALAQKLSHPLTLALALGSAAWTHGLRREEQLAQERAEATITLCTEHGFPVFLAGATILHGWALAEQGQGEEGIAEIHQGLAAWQATGARQLWPVYLARLAEAYGRRGQAEEGLNVLAKALDLMQTTGERRWEAELYRLKGQLTLQAKVPSLKSQVGEALPDRAGSAHQNVSISEAGTVGGAHPTREAEAEGYFLKAIDIARKQQAKSLELRAVMNLSRLWQRQGKKKEAHRMLAEIYNWFTEGFETKDLREAKALLQELA